MIVMNYLLKAIEAQLKETQKLADNYREQVIALEDKLAHIREEGDIGKELFKVSTVSYSFYLHFALHSGMLKINPFKIPSSLKN